MRSQPFSSNRLLTRTLLATAILLSATAPAVQSSPSPLTISSNRHHFTTTNGTPFFYLADTAWELAHRADREDTRHYLRNRARKGFTVIHTAILAELDGVRSPNAFGELPFIDLAPSQPNETFFAHVDYIVEEAAGLGLRVGLAPTWGDKVNRRWGAGPGNFFDKDTAASFGEFLGERYKDKPVIWILGGDRNPESEEQLDIWQAMANGLKDGGTGSTLVTYHPMAGGNSAKWFPDDSPLDFDFIHSGQSSSITPIHDIFIKLRERNPSRPVLDGEPCFEDHPIAWNPANGWFDAWDVRQAAYVAVLSGAAGHTYGNHNVWQLWTTNRPPVLAARTPWRDALEHPGAEQMGFMRTLFESRPWHELEPDTEAASDADDSSSRVVAARSSSGSFLFAYTPEEKAITVDLQKLTGEKLIGYWCNPRDGSSTPVNAFTNTSKPKTFTPPETGPRIDWLLLLEDASKNFSAP